MKLLQHYGLNEDHLYSSLTLENDVRVLYTGDREKLWLEVINHESKINISNSPTNV